MKAVRAVFRDGLITLSEPPPGDSPAEVLVVFPEPADDPWEPLLRDPSPRLALMKRIEEVEAEIAAGRATPLDHDRL